MPSNDSQIEIDTAALHRAADRIGTEAPSPLMNALADAGARFLRESEIHAHERGDELMESIVFDPKAIGYGVMLGFLAATETGYRRARRGRWEFRDAEFLAATEAGALAELAAEDFETDTSAHDAACDCKACLLNAWHTEVEQLQGAVDRLDALRAAVRAYLNGAPLDADGHFKDPAREALYRAASADAVG
jgi:hypothetical protein